MNKTVCKLLTIEMLGLFKILTIYLRLDVHTPTMKSVFIFLISFAFLFSTISIGSVIAQNQSQSQNQSSMLPENQTLATITDSPQTLLANQTTIPAEQTKLTVDRTTEQIQDQAQIQPLENQTIKSEIGSLSNMVDNETNVQATGPATTTIANQTIVPFNETTIGATNMTN